MGVIDYYIVLAAATDEILTVITISKLLLFHFTHDKLQRKKNQLLFSNTVGIKF